MFPTTTTTNAIGDAGRAQGVKADACHATGPERHEWLAQNDERHHTSHDEGATDGSIVVEEEREASGARSGVPAQHCWAEGFRKAAELDAWS